MYISWCIFSFSEYWCHCEGQRVLMPSWRRALLPWDFPCSPGRIAWEGDTQTETQTDFATTRPTRPRRPSWWKFESLRGPLPNCIIYLKFAIKNIFIPFWFTLSFIQIFPTLQKKQPNTVLLSHQIVFFFKLTCSCLPASAICRLKTEQLL